MSLRVYQCAAVVKTCIARSGQRQGSQTRGQASSMQSKVAFNHRARKSGCSPGDPRSHWQTHRSRPRIARLPRRLLLHTCWCGPSRCLPRSRLHHHQQHCHQKYALKSPQVARRLWRLLIVLDGKKPRTAELHEIYCLQVQEHRFERSNTKQLPAQTSSQGPSHLSAWAAAAHNQARCC